MTTDSSPMTPTDLIAATASVLEGGGYQAIQVDIPTWATPSTRLFEDKYNVVGVAVFSTCAELLDSWADLQGALVDVISRYVGQAESKAWDGYLVLLTQGIAPSGDPEIEELQYDTARLRKLVATGEDLVAPGDVERLLRPLLPLRSSQLSIRKSGALDRLPSLLAEQRIDASTTETLVKAFMEQEPMMEALHRRRVTQ